MSQIIDLNNPPVLGSMQWTLERPMKPGMYFTLNAQGLVDVMQLYEDHHGAQSEGLMTGEFSEADLEDPIILFAGPIPYPHLAQGNV